jgi:hypothetical protein
MENTNMNKVLGYYGAELFTEWNNNATFIMESCYTADDYDVFWCHPAEEMMPKLDYDVYYHAENCVDVFVDALKAGESIYIDGTLYDEIHVDDLINEMAEDMELEEVEGEILNITD